MIATKRFFQNFFSSRLLKTLSLAVPYLMLICAFVLLVVSYLTLMPMNFLIIACGVAITIAFVILRQWLALAENTRLVNQLNLAVERVQNQAAEVEKYNLELQSEIAERKKVEGQLAHDALHDGLTGLPNRVLFLDRLEHAIQYGKRHPAFRFAVLFMDLDHFKVVNDSLGHTVGDDLLISFGQRLLTCLRTSYSIARLGGDEFVVLLEDVKDEKSVTQAAERILEMQREHFYINGRHMFTSASIGIVIQTGEYSRAEDLLRDADIAMYHAKDLGKARYAVFSPELRNKAIVRLELENELRQAVECKEFQLYYQPIYQLWSEQVTGFEALIRWNHPQRGLLKPESFLSIAEESDLILIIGDWVLRKACTQMKCWREMYPQFENLAVNVNISGRQLSQPDFVEQVERALLDTGLPASALKLEITESTVIQNQLMANDFFTRLSSLGIQLQVDDFGTGYSSLSYLQLFPIHCIKIDRSFIQDIGRPGKNQDLVRTMIMMAKDLGMEAIAEGIETQEQLELLQSLACHRGQGFLMSRPLDEISAERLLQEMNSLQVFPIKIARANEPLPVSASRRTKAGSG
jgi:diguanylate cyclase (GGDEF)-like protein